MIVDFLDICIVKGVGSLVGSEKVVIGEGFAGVAWGCFRGAERKVALDLEVLKIDHGVFFLYFIANNQVDTKRAIPPTMPSLVADFYSSRLKYRVGK